VAHAKRRASREDDGFMTAAADDSHSAKKDGAPLIDELTKIPHEPAPDGTTPLQMRAFLALAMAKHREGKLAEAEQMYRQALRWQPDHPDPYHLLGLLAAQLNRADDALPLFERAIALDPTVPEYHANYGNALTIAARTADAEAAFGKAVALRPDFPEALMNLATVRRTRGDLEGAERLLHRALELRPDWPDAQLNLANVALAQQRFTEATTLFARALKAEPNYVHAYEGFARAAARAGRLDEAAAAFQRLLTFDPKNVVARHLLAACIPDPHYDKAPDAYIRRLFDHYAPQFDVSLAHLQYRAPALIADRLAASVAPNGSLDILDAGCGTGLCAPLLKPFAARLVGVDLSAGMLKEAAKRELYDELVEAELAGFMAARASSFDAIVCCDTLVYQGRLEETVAAAATALKPGGRLLFTLEQLIDDSENVPYRLAPTGRFCHSAAYVQAVLAKAGLIDGHAEAITPRLECGEPVQGLLVTARGRM
jgi:predicted TPR repeat methyltransferase